MYFVGQPIFEIPPYFFRGVEFRCIRWDENKLNIRRYFQLLAFMKSTIVEKYDFNLIRALFTEFVKVKLKAVCVAFWQFECELCSGYRGKRTEQIEILKLMLICD